MERLYNCTEQVYECIHPFLVEGIILDHLKVQVGEIWWIDKNATPGENEVRLENETYWIKMTKEEFSKHFKEHFGICETCGKTLTKIIVKNVALREYHYEIECTHCKWEGFTNE